jgi:hypothetical protein
MLDCRTLRFFLALAAGPGRARGKRKDLTLEFDPAMLYMVGMAHLTRCWARCSAYLIQPVAIGN